MNYETRSADPPNLISEADFQATVIEMARAFGYLVAHTHDSRYSEPGVPDLLIVSQAPKTPRIIFAELKKEGGKLTEGKQSKRTGRYLPGQVDWMNALGRCAEGPPVEVYVWYPKDLDIIERILRDYGNEDED